MSTRTRRWTIVGTVQYVSVLAGLAMAQDSSPIAQAARRAALNGRAAAAPSVVSPPSRPWAQAAQSGRAANTVKGRDAPQPTRPAEPASPPNPAELTVRPDERGMVRFNFHGQPWDDVLKWLADISDMSLDWQELPSDYLNLATKRSYTVAEARDLINRHLLARGYTLLQQGEVLSAVNLTNLDPAMVPRVTPEELARRSPHEFVKVSFSLDWLLAQEMALELEALCSPYGQLVPLTRTNRLEVIDAVVNLREIHRLLEQEQSADRQSRLVREFPLRYTRASQVREQLQAILGIQSMSLSPPASPQAMLTPLQQAAMRAQLLRQQRLRQQRAQPSRGASPIATISTAVTLVANPRRNSIFAHAPPDKMAIIASFIRLVDVPSQEPQPLQANLIRLRTYRLATIDPLILVDVLEDMGGLEPTTQLKVDQKHQAVIVQATAYDHMVIQSLIDKLDGSARRFEVIQLHRLAADEVAGTVEFMMGAGELAERSQPHRPANYTNSSLIAQHVPWTADHDRFRVSANVEQNQLLLWCNDVEFTEVENLMVKLGEIPTAGATASRIRVIDIPQGEQRAAFLEQLRRVWPTVAPNELLLPSTSRSRVRPLGDGERKRDTRRPPDSSPSSSATTQTIPPYVPRADLGPARSRSGDPVSHQVVPDSEVVSWPYAVKTIGQPALRIAQLPRGKYDPPSSADNALSPWAENGLDATSRAASARSLPTPLLQDESVATSPPVAITIAPDGRIVVTSQDTEALDRFQELTSQLLPPRKQFDIFYLQYAPAYLVSLKLEDFFRPDEDADQDVVPSNSDRGAAGNTSRKRPPERLLSKRRAPKFISDSDTNSILVQGADGAQRRTIADLIELFDVPKPLDPNKARVTKIYHLRYSQAQVVAETIKDAYRDLLSSNDRALRPPSRQTLSSNDRAGSRGGENTEGKLDTWSRAAFRGKLSLGVDALTNSLMVSAEGDDLLGTIGKTILELDEAAKPVSKFHVMRLGGRVNASEVQRALRGVLGQSSTTGAARATRRPPAPAGRPSPTSRQQPASTRPSNPASFPR